MVAPVRTLFVYPVKCTFKHSFFPSSLLQSTTMPRHPFFSSPAPDSEPDRLIALNPNPVTPPRRRGTLTPSLESPLLEADDLNMLCLPDHLVGASKSILQTLNHHLSSPWCKLIVAHWYTYWVSNIIQPSEHTPSPNPMTASSLFHLPPQPALSAASNTVLQLSSRRTPGLKRKI